MMKIKSVFFAVLLFLIVTLTTLMVGCEIEKSEDPVYKVSFYNGETLISTIEVDWSEEVGFPASIPTKEEDENYTYTFKGWATEKSATEVVSGTVRAYSDMTFYAIYTATEKEAAKIYFVVTFIDAHTGQIIGEPQQIEQGEDAVLPIPPDHTDEGLLFVGWSANHTNIQRTTTIRALYEYSTVTLTRHYLGQTRAEQVLSGAEINTEEPTISSAFVFEGWYWDDQFTHPVSTTDNKMPFADADVYAKISVNFQTAELSVSENLVYGNNNTVTVTGLMGEGIIDYTYEWSAENTLAGASDSQKQMRNAGNYEIAVTITATYSFGGQVVLSETHGLSGSYQVAKAPLTITISTPPEIITYGTDHNVTTQFVDSEFKYEDSADIVTVNLEFTRYNDSSKVDGQSVDSEQLDVGYYVVSATATELANYSIRQIRPIEFSVVKKDLTVGFTVRDITYGDDISEGFLLAQFTYDQSQLVYGQDISIIGNPQFVILNESYSQTTNALNAGVYYVSIEGLSSANYNLVYTQRSATFTVNKKPSTMLVTAQSWTYGENENYSYSYDGILAGDVSLFNFKLSYLKDGAPYLYVGERLGAGEYVISLGYTENSNYDMDESLSFAAFTVSKAQLSARVSISNAQGNEENYHLTYGTVPNSQVEFYGFIQGEKEVYAPLAQVRYYLDSLSRDGAMLDAATYSVKIDGLDELSNYQFTQQNTLNLQVLKKAFDITVILSADNKNEHTYGEYANNIRDKFTYELGEFAYPNENVSTVFGSLSLSLLHANGEAVTASVPSIGEYVVTVQAARQASNYDVTIYGVDVTVSKAKLEISGLKSEELIYGQKPTSILQISGFIWGEEAQAGAKLVYKNGDVEYDDASNKFPVGEYELKINFENQEILYNYEWSQPNHTVIVLPKSLTLSFAVEDIVFGQEIEYNYSFAEQFAYNETISEIYPNLVVAYYSGDEEYVSPIRYFASGSYIAKIFGLESSNYVVANPEAATTNFDVQKYEFDVKQNERTSRLDNWSFSPAISSEEFILSGTIMLNTTDVGTYVWNSGSHSQELDWVSGFKVTMGELDVTENFTPVYDVSITLISSNFKFNAPSPAIFTYDGNSHAFPIDVDGVLYEQDSQVMVTVEYSINGVQYSTTVPQFINAGSYTVYYRISAPNYNNEEGSMFVRCDKARNSIFDIKIIDENNIVYDGQTRVYDISASSNFGNVIVKLNDVVVSQNVEITDVGNYEFEFIVEGTDNYDGATIHRFINVSKASYVVTAISTQTHVYDGNDFGSGVSVIAKGDDQFTVSYTVDGVISQSVPKFTDANKYTVWYTVSGNANYYDYTNKYTVEITQASNAISEIKFENDTFIYDENSHSYNVSASSIFGDVIVTVNDTIAEGSYAITNVGMYTFIFKVAETANYKGVTVERTITVNKAQAVISGIAFENGSFTYDGENHSYNVSASSNFGNVKVTVNGSEVNESYTITNVGAYTFTFLVAGTDNYEGASIARTVTVNQATVNTISVKNGEGEFNGETITYNGSIREYSLIAIATFGEPSVTYEYKGTSDSEFSAVAALSVLNAGTYRIIYAVAETANYVGTRATVTITVNKAKYTATNLNDDQSYVYEPNQEFGLGIYVAVFGDDNYIVSYTEYEKISVASAIETYSVVNGKVAIDDTSVPPKFTSAGTYVVYYTVFGNANYDDLNGSYQITVAKADNQITVEWDSEEFIYDGQNHVYSLAYNTIFGSAYVTCNGEEVSGNSYTIKNVGVYTIAFVVSESENYNEAELERVVNVTKADYQISNNGDQDGYVYSGFAFGENITISAKGSDVFAVTYFAVVDGDEVSASSVNGLGLINAGVYTVNYVVAEDTANYNANANASGSFKLTISKANRSIDISNAKTTYVYTGYEQAVSLENITVSDSEGTLVISDETIQNALFTDVPTSGKISVMLEVAETANYNATSKEFTVTVDKASLTATVILASNQIVFGDSPNASIILSGLVGEDTKEDIASYDRAITYFVGEGEYEMPASGLIEAGSYKVKAVGLESANYQIVTIDATLTVSKKEFVIYVSTTQNYTKPWSVKPSFGDGEQFVFSGTLKLVNNETGTYTLTTAPEANSDFVWESVPTITYNGVDVTTSFDIKYDISVTLNEWNFIIELNGSQRVTYDGNEHFVVVNAQPAIDADIEVITVEYSLGGSEYVVDVPKFINAGEYTVYYRVSAEGYDTVESYFTINIDKATNTIINSAVTVNGDSNLEVVYVGSEYNVVVNADVKFGSYTVVYKINGEEYNDKFINVGTYEIVITSLEDETNYFSDTNTFYVNINKATLSATPTTNEPYVYTGNEQGHGVAIQGLYGDDTVTVTYDGESQYPTFTDVGEYVVNYTVSDNDNYHEKQDSFTVIITRAQAEIEIQAFTIDGNPISESQVNYAYRGTAYAVVMVAQANFGEVSAKYEYRDVGVSEFSDVNTLSVLDAGSYRITLFVEEDDNYNGTSISKVITINQAIYTVVAPENNVFDYNGSSQGQTVGLINVLGDEVTDAVISYQNGYQFTNAGAHNIGFTVNGDDNYLSEHQSYIYTLVINKINYVITGAVDQEYTYNGNEQGNGVVVTGINGISMASKLTIGQISFVNAGTYTVEYSVQSDNNYIGASGSYTITIAKADVNEITIKNGEEIWSGAEFTYDGVEHAYSLIALATFGTPNVGYEYKATSASEFSDVNTLNVRNAGTYRITYSVGETANYVGATAQRIITVNKAQAVITVDMLTVDSAELKDSYTYRASEFVVEARASANYGEVITSYKVNNGVVTTTKPTFKDAGEYDIIFSVEGTANYYSAYVTKTIKINPFTLAVADNVKAQEYEYNTTAKGVGISFSNVAPDNGYTITYKVGEDENTITVPTFISAGSYTVSYTVEGANYTTVSGTYTVTINKADYIVTAPDQNDYTYNGASQGANIMVTAYVGDAYTVQYALSEGGQFVDSIAELELVDAGDYTVYYLVSGNDNYNDASGSFSVSIANADFGVTAPNVDLTYDGNAQGGSDIGLTIATKGANDEYELQYVAYSKQGQSVVMSIVPSESTEILDKTAPPMLTEAGTYNIFYTISGKNYNTIESFYTVTIDKAERTLNGLDNVTSVFTYNGAEQYINVGAVTIADTEGEITVTTTLENNAIKFKDVPTSGKIIVTFTVGETANYYGVTANKEIIVNKANYTITLPTASGSYTANAWNKGVTVSAYYDDEFETTYTYNSITKPSIEAFEFINVGVYQVTYSVSGNDNYNNVENEPLNINIIMATDTNISATVTASDKSTSDETPISIDYVEQGYEVLITYEASYNASVTVEYRYNGGEKSQVKPAFKDVGIYEIIFSVAKTNNYNGASVTRTVVITKAQAVITIDNLTVDGEELKDSYTYKASEFIVATSASANYGNVTTSYKVNGGEATATKPTFKDVATYEIIFSVEGTANYNGASITKTVNITKAQATISGIKIEDHAFTYDGEAHNYDISATSSFGSVTVTLNGSVVSGSVSLTNAGTYEITFTVAGNANYDGASVTKTIKINPFALIVADNNQSYGYDSTAKGVGISFANTAPDNGYTITYNSSAGNNMSVAPTFVNADTYTVSYTVSGANYTTVSGTYTVAISKATLSVTGVGASETFTYGERTRTVGQISISGTKSNADASAISLTVTLTKNGAAVNDFVNDGAYVISNKGTYVVSYVVNYSAVSGNYTLSTASGSFTVTVKGIALTLDSSDIVKTYTYTGAEQIVDLTKVIIKNGDAVMSLSDFADSDNATISYSGDVTITNGTFSFTNVVDGNGKTVRITLSVSADSNYAGAETTIVITVNKANYTEDEIPETDEIQEIMMLGKTLSSIPLSDFVEENGEKPYGYFTWKNSNTEIVLGEKAYAAYYNADPSNYNSYETTLTIVARKEKISIEYEQVIEARIGQAATYYDSLMTVTYVGERLRDDGTYILTAAEIAEFGLPTMTDEKIDYTVGGTYLLTYTINFTENDYCELEEDIDVFYAYFKLKSVDVGGTLYTLEDALNVAQSGLVTVKYDTVMASNEVKEMFGLYSGTGYFTVKSDVTLLVPRNASDNNTSHTMQDPDIGTAAPSSVEDPYSTLWVTSNLTVNGKIFVNALATSSGQVTTVVSGTAYGRMDVAEGVTVTINDGAEFESIGYSTGAGEIIAKDGSSVYELFNLVGWRGGGISTTIMNNVFPLNQFTVASIETRLKLEAGAEYYLRAGITVNLLGQQAVDVKFLSSEETSFMELASGHIYKWIDMSNGSVHFELHGNVTFHNLALSLGSSYNFSTKGLVTPIPGVFNITVAEGTTTIPNDLSMKFLPGAKLNVNKNAILNIAGNLYVFSGDGVTYAGNKGETVTAWTDQKTYPLVQTDNGIVYRLKDVYRGTISDLGYTNTTPAQMTVEGTVNVSGTLGGAVKGMQGGVIGVGGNATLGGTVTDFLSYTTSSFLGITTYDCTYFTSTFTVLALNGDSSTVSVAKDKGYVYNNGVWQEALNTVNYSVTYNANGGNHSDVGTVPYTVYMLEQANEVMITSFNTPDPTLALYRFTGWYLDSANSSGVSLSDTTAPVSYDNPLTIQSGASISVYAGWEKVSYTVEFVIAPYGAEVPPIEYDETWRTGEEAITLPTPVTVEGVVFGGWYTNADYTARVTSIGDSNISSFELTSNTISVYGYFYKQDVNIVYRILDCPYDDINVDVAFPTSNTATVGGALGVSNIIDASGYGFDKHDYDLSKQYYFAGWYTTSGQKVTESTVITVDMLNINGELDIIAMWISKPTLTVIVTATGTTGSLVSKGKDRTATCTVTIVGTSVNETITATGKGGSALWGKGGTETNQKEYHLCPGQKYKVDATSGSISGASDNVEQAMGTSSITVTVSNS